jgi:hypothetical protein
MRLWPFRRKTARILDQAVWATYDWPLTDVLLEWGPKDQFTIRDAVASVFIMGAIGSGKSSGSGKLLALSYLSAGFGMLVLCAKSDEADVFTEYCRITGRTADLIRFSVGGPWRFDPLNYELTREGSGAGMTENIVGLLCSMLEIADRNAGGGGGGRDEEGFWKRMLRQLLRNLVDLIVLARGRVTVPDLYRLLVSAPSNLDEVRSAQFRAKSFCFECLDAAEKGIKTPRQKHDFDLVADYLLWDLPRLSEKTRSIIMSSFTSMIDVIQRGALRELHCTETNVTPLDIERGRIVVVDVSVREFGDVGLFTAMIWKYSFQKSIERRDVVKSPRPVALWADEAQNFLSSYDQLFLSTSRSAKVSTVFLTQNIANVYAALGGEKGKYEADSILGNFATKVFHANGCHLSNTFASEALGSSRQFLMSGNSQQGEQTAFQMITGTGRSTSSAGYSESVLPEIDPGFFTQLRTGGPGHSWLVDAVIFSNGVKFKSTGKPYLLTTFRQR